MTSKEEAEIDITDTSPPSNCCDKKVTINVGGVKHNTWLRTLEKVPGTRLAMLADSQESDEAYDSVTKEYFFDRHAGAFENILHYYRSSELHMDQSMCGNIMRGELKYWGLEESDIEPCCWAVYSKNTEHKKTLEDLDENFAYINKEAWEEEKETTWKDRIWNFVEEPSSSRAAKVYAVISMFFVALSICIFVLETHKMFQVDDKTKKSMMELEPEDPWTPTGSPRSCCCEQDYNNTGAVAVTHPVLVYLDWICVSWFILELAIRFIFCPKKLKFFRDPMNIIDVICLVPHIASVTIRSINSASSAAAVLKTVLMMRIVRILRIFKLMKHYSAFKILVYTLKVSTKELFLMVVFLMSGVLMFASLVHYIERENFPNIPIGIWWALVTMTTVGYGDKYTVTIPGYIVGSLCVISGVLVIAFTVPIVVNNFSLYYSHAQTRIKAPIRRKKERKSKSDKSRHRSNGRRLPEDHVGNSNSSFDTLQSSSRETSSVTTDSDQRALVQSRNAQMLTGQKEKLVIRKRQTNNCKEKEDSDNVNQKNSRKTFSQAQRNTTPIEKINAKVEDIESFDSGFDETQHGRTNRQIEEESKKIIETLAKREEKEKLERKRQENLIRLKRAQRAKVKAAILTPRDIKLSDFSHHPHSVADSDPDQGEKEEIKLQKNME